jgi:hypothetical protein
MSTLAIPAAVMVSKSGRNLPIISKVLPVTVEVGQILLEGIPINPSVKPVVTTFELQRARPGQGVRVFDVNASSWVDVGNIHTVSGPMTYAPSSTTEWKGTLIPATLGTDILPGDLFSVRVVCRVPGDSGPNAAGLAGPSSAAFQIVKATDQTPVGVMPNNEDIDAATSITLFARRGSGQSIVGSVEVSQSANGGEIRISSSNGCHIVLLDSGAIELFPKAGQLVRVRGNLQADNLFRTEAGVAKVVT